MRVYFFFAFVTSLRVSDSNKMSGKITGIEEE